MEPMQFAYWLQGFAELNEAPPSPEQWKSIKEHLSTVFNKLTPPVGFGTHDHMMRELEKARANMTPDLWKSYPPIVTPGATPLKYPDIICSTAVC